MNRNILLLLAVFGLSGCATDSSFYTAEEVDRMSRALRAIAVDSANRVYGSDAGHAYQGSAAIPSGQAQPANQGTGQYLGNASANRYDPNSVSNPYGRYGSKYSPNSVNNPYSKHGSAYSNSSVNNPYATNAPAIVAPSSSYGIGSGSGLSSGSGMGPSTW